MSDHDFEQLCRDLLAVELEQRVESFARGADQGIDLRCYIAGDSAVIAQCKHYLRSSYSDLMRGLKREKLKLGLLRRQPARYLLYTTHDLSPHQKRSIKSLMEPYIQVESDILALGDIEGILALHPELEQRHYKLWLSSTSVIRRIIGSAALNRSTAMIEDILDRSRLYVPHANIKRARDILKASHTVIISGPPGIGKTTMAHMLALELLEQDFEITFIRSIRELESEILPGKQQVFLYDDFLGRSSLSERSVGDNDEQLLHTIAAVKRPDHRFIATTREYLYQEAVRKSDRLSTTEARLLKCLIDVSGYNRRHRAEILYNHLYWAEDLTVAEIREFVETGGYWKVIDHKNFNPRLLADWINSMSSIRKMGAVDDGNN